ncbi:MAG: NUDIX domain-containing protein [Lachnospiraceae bacterium]|nr:NUDIX domain-containing protein [Lachnospiraceae bacterium]
MYENGKAKNMKNTTLGYIEYNDCFLMLLRDIDKSDGSLGKWLGVGGKLEKGENADDCFIREAFEETGIKLSKEQIKRRGIVDFESDKFAPERMFLYTASADSDFFRDSDEGTLKWVKKDEVLSLNMWEGDHIFLEKLLSREGFFAISLRYGGESGDVLKEVIDGKLILTDVDDVNDEKLSFYSSLNETQLKHFYEPEPGLFIAETFMVIERAIDAGYEPVNILCEQNRLFDAAAYDYLNVPLYSAPGGMLKQITGYNLTMGMLSGMKRKPLLSVDELLCDSNIRRIAVLEDVENPTNTGALVRSAAALGIDAMIFTKDGADPLYRRAIRVAVGNIFSLPYTVVSGSSWIKALKDAGVKIVSLALSDNSVNLGDEILNDLKSERVAICLGNEKNGVTKELAESSDFIVKIPMAKNVDSLNVAAAGAVAFWEIGRK